MHRFNDKRRGISSINLQLCFPEKSDSERDSMVRECFCMLGQSVLDYGVFWWRSSAYLERLIRLEGLEHVQRELDAGRGVVLLVTHSLFLDAGGLAISRKIPVVGMFNRAKNPLVDWFIARGRIRFAGGGLISREEGLRPGIRALRAGISFYYLADEDLGAEHSRFVPFFGIPRATITALPRLAKVSKAAVVPLTSYWDREKKCYVAKCLPALENYPSGEEEADLKRMSAANEALIKLAPEQYMWQFRLFKTRPQGEVSPYQGLRRGQYTRKDS
ncbi:lauroyl-KDO2-lipid IV(A) myristoyltransferase [Thiohalomonas denitrificans]|uniref:Lauroyl-KDO2-lipid IV(A) myristoyltransferase n=2 Tax=Thiohalomonas denitrificans TaxID=415747 RepID=A0A1G5PRW5_9GAMM|nr:lauroyl-KDO2-lipid IV(A) myristoyltransferase [Thiohalomonas denitrificans]